MPKGQPKNGFRVTKKMRAAGFVKSDLIARPMRIDNTGFHDNTIEANMNRLKVHSIDDVTAQVTAETDEAIEMKLSERFNVYSQLVDAAIDGVSRSLIVSGPAGLGKSYTAEEKLKSWNPEGDLYTIISGNTKATGLYRTLHQFRHPGSVVVLDDVDVIFRDELCLNLLKKVCDSSDNRRVSWGTETRMESEEGGTIDRSFQFDGSVIFITNLDFDMMIEKGNMLSPHLSALVSRSHYIDLGMKTKRDYLVRIRQVVKQGMLDDMGIDDASKDEVVHFIEQNADRLRELSLRMVKKIADIRRIDPVNWKSVARITCMRAA